MWEVVGAAGVVSAACAVVCTGRCACAMNIAALVFPCSKRRIARLKQANQLWTKRHLRFGFTSKADPAHARYPNILDRRFKTTQANRVWVGDVTSV
jgi:transposase InsO family protein